MSEVGSGVCLHCGFEWRGNVPEEHFDQGRCRKREPVFMGEIIEGPDGRLRLMRGGRSRRLREPGR